MRMSKMLPSFAFFFSFFPFSLPFRFFLLVELEELLLEDLLDEVFELLRRSRRRIPLMKAKASVFLLSGCGSSPRASLNVGGS